jgi:plastocyanin
MFGTHGVHWAVAAAALLAASAVEPHPTARTSRAPAAAPAKTVEVQMFGDASGYRFAPATVTIQRGDKVRFTLVSGPPHNVVFWPDSIPKGAAAALAKGMPQTVDKLTSPYYLKAGDSYVVSFDGVPAGTYRYYCTPHLALGMKAVIVVK